MSVPVRCASGVCRQSADHRLTTEKNRLGQSPAKIIVFVDSFCFLLTFGTQGSQVAKSQQVLLPNYVALYKSRLQFGWGTVRPLPTVPTHGTFRNGGAPPGDDPQLRLVEFGPNGVWRKSRRGRLSRSATRSQSRPKPNGHAPDPRVTHGQHPFSYRWTAASSSFSSATVRSIMPCAKSSIGNPSTRR
jgi:hypothetical protein